MGSWGLVGGRSDESVTTHIRNFELGVTRNGLEFVAGNLNEPGLWLDYG